MFLDGLAVSGLICPGQMPAAEVRSTLSVELDRLVTEVTAASGASGSRRAGGVERLVGLAHRRPKNLVPPS
jgi:hypothetical protein